MPSKLWGQVCDNCRVFWDAVLKKSMNCITLSGETYCFCSDKCKEEFDEETKE